MLYSFTPRCPYCTEHIAFIGAPHPIREECPHNQGYIPEKLDVELAVYRGWAKYPSLYGRNLYTRWRVLGYLFLALGNGYIWRDGRLVDPTEDQNVIPPIKTGAQYRHEILADPDMMGFHEKLSALFGEPYTISSGDEYEEVWANMNEPNRFAPIVFGISLISTVPDGAAKEWVEAAWSLVWMMGRAGDSYNKDGLDRVRLDLTERFGVGG